MTTQIFDPTHLSMSSTRAVSNKLNGKGLSNEPRGSNCEAILTGFVKIRVEAKRMLVSRDWEASTTISAYVSPPKLANMALDKRGREKTLKES